MSAPLTSCLALLVLLPGCLGAEDAAPPDAAVAPPEPEVVRIALQRTACYGRCPVYRVEVDAAGEVVYSGERHVATVGEARGSVGADVVAALADAFAEADFASLPDSLTWDADVCQPAATDHPSVVTTLETALGTKTVHHDHGCRRSARLDSLRELERRIDLALNTARWVER